jgi:hypothetical protein
MDDFEDCQIDFDSQGEEDDEKLVRQVIGKKNQDAKKFIVQKKIT